MARGQNGNHPSQTKARWDRLARHYGLIEYFSERHLRPWRKAIWQQASGLILEVGVGTGLNLPFYPSVVRAAACDLSGAMLLKARKRARKKDIDIEFCEADVCDLPFHDDIFDTAVATFVFCSLPDPLPCLQEMGRVTKSQGRILLLDHVRIDRPVIGTLMDLVNRATVRFAGEHITHRMEDFVREAGLEIVESHQLGFMGIFQLIVARPRA